METLKTYRLPIGMIALGAGLIALVWKVNIKWIALPIFLVGGALILLGLIIAGKIAEAQVRVAHPEYDEPIGQISIIERILHYGGYAGLVSVIILLSLKGKVFDNTIGGVEIFFKCLVVGILTAILFYKCLKKVYPIFIRYNKDRQSSLFGWYFAVTIWTIYGITVCNEINAAVRVEKVLVLEKSKNIRHGTPFLFLQINGKRERFVPKKSEWKEIQERDSIYLSILQGRFGFDIVTGFYAELPEIRQPQTTR